ncbi:MAG: hypothetical protein P1U34_12350 [Coxiellaceae bacterium]|nr:hypothetical protein [Coxiellaceae bacterium]
MAKIIKGPVLAKLLRNHFGNDVFVGQVAQSLDSGELTPAQLALVKSLVNSDIVATGVRTKALVKFAVMILASHYQHPEHDDPKLANQYISQILTACKDGDFDSIAFILANASSIHLELLNPIMQAISRSPLDVMKKLFSYCDVTARGLWITTMAKKAVNLIFYHPGDVDDEDHPAFKWFNYQIAINPETIDSPAYNIWLLLESYGPPGIHLSSWLFKKMVASFLTASLMPGGAVSLLEGSPGGERLATLYDGLSSIYGSFAPVAQGEEIVEDSAMNAFITCCKPVELVALTHYLMAKKINHALAQYLFDYMGKYHADKYVVLTTHLSQSLFEKLAPRNIDDKIDDYALLVSKLTAAVDATYFHKQLLQVSRLMFLKYPFVGECVENYYHNLKKIRYSLLTPQQHDEIYGLITYLSKVHPSAANTKRYIHAVEHRYGVVGALDAALTALRRDLYSREEPLLKQWLLNYAVEKAHCCVESADAMYMIAKMHDLAVGGDRSETAELFYEKAAMLGHPEGLRRYPEYKRSEPLPPTLDASVFPTEFLGDLYTARREDGSYTRVLCDWVRLLMMAVGVTATVKVDGIKMKPEGAHDIEVKRLFNLISTQAQHKITADEAKTEEAKRVESQQWVDMQADYSWADTYCRDHTVPGDDDALLQRLDAGHTVHLNDYWVDRRGAHVMGLTFFKADGQYYLIRSNKGAGAIDEVPGISIYRVDNIAGIATKKDVEHFLKNCRVTEFSENMDPTKQGGVAHYLGLHKIAEFNKTPQKTGNCGTANLINYMLAFLMAKYTQSQFGMECAAGADEIPVPAGAGQDPAVDVPALGSAIPDGFFDHCFQLINDSQFKSLRALVREIGIEQLVELAMVGTHPVVMDKAEHVAMMQQVIRYIHQKYAAPKAGEVLSDDGLCKQAENKTRWFKAVDRLATDKHKTPYASSDVVSMYSGPSSLRK